MKHPLHKFITPVLVVPILLTTLGTSYAQTDVKVKVETKKQTQQAPATVAVDADPTPPNKDPNNGITFTPLGKEIARPAVRIPVGATTLLQVTAPLGSSGTEQVLVHIYKLNDAMFLNVLTAKGKQVWTKRNSIRLLAPLPAHADALTVTWRYLEPRKQRGLMITASDDAMHYVLAFPKGFGGSVTQQQFLTTSKTGTQSTYQFSDLDGRGFAIVKATVVSAGGEIKAGDAMQYFVWNGKRFIPRAYN